MSDADRGEPSAKRSAVLRVPADPSKPLGPPDRGSDQSEGGAKVQGHGDETPKNRSPLSAHESAGNLAASPSTQEKSHQRQTTACLLYTSPSPRDGLLSRM